MCISLTWTILLEANPDEKPTPRAVSEHIFKLKKIALAELNGEVAAISTPRGPRKKNVSATSTPRTGSKVGGLGASSSTSASASASKGKRKRVDVEESAERLANNSFTPVNGSRIKKEYDDGDSIGDLGPMEKTPSKRARKPVKHLNMAAYDESGTEADAEADEKGSNRFSSADPEYAPAEDPEEFFQMPEFYWWYVFFF